MQVLCVLDNKNLLVPLSYLYKHLAGCTEVLNYYWATQCWTLNLTCPCSTATATMTPCAVVFQNNFILLVNKLKQDANFISLVNNGNQI